MGFNAELVRKLIRRIDDARNSDLCRAHQYDKQRQKDNRSWMWTRKAFFALSQLVPF